VDHEGAKAAKRLKGIGIIGEGEDGDDNVMGIGMSSLNPGFGA